MPSLGDEPQLDLNRRFERCFRDNYAAVLAFAIRRLADRATAEDAVSETFAVAWRRRDLVPDVPLPWLYAIALRVIANQRRSLQRRHRLGERLAHEPGVDVERRDPADALHHRDAVSDGLRKLDEPEREVLRLIAWEGLGTRDAARVLGCSPGAFRVRLHRARRKLAKHLEAAGHLPDERRGTAPDPAEEVR
jgi:RNA polymerase sigma-70 factor (ECF subfamily)